MLGDEPRDRVFANFARLVVDEIALVSYPGRLDSSEAEEIITQRAYDLAVHVLSEITGIVDPERILTGDVDMEVLP